METVTSSDGTPIAYERTGRGPPLVLVHGASVDHTTWADVLPFLEAHVTVYAMDRRGRGESGDVQQTSSAEPTRTGGSGNAETYSLEREVEDVVAVVDSIDGPVDLLGHSFGGVCALEAALVTDRLGRLVLYEPEVVAEVTPDEERALSEIRNAIEASDREDALVTFYREFARLSEAEIEHARSQPTWSRRVDAVHTVLRELDVGYGYDFEPERFREMTVPTLLLVGEESPPIAHRDAKTIRDALPDCRIASLEDQGHVAYRMAPERFAETVVEFLRASS